MIETSKVRLGFVGCGGIAISHLKGLVKNPHVNLVAFCDINLNRARIIAKRYGDASAAAFSSAEEMFKEASIDAVYFCLPPFAHGAEFEAIDRGVPFFVEKPINLYLDQAVEIADAVERRGLMTSVGYMNRYRRGIQRAREVFREDPPILLLGGWIGKTPQARPDAQIWRWWIIKEKSGGQFHEQVTHSVDLARFIVGEISEVHAFPAKGFNKDVPPGYNIEDASVVNLKFTSGAVGNLWASCSANAGGGGVSLRIYANKTTAIFDGWEHNLRLLRVEREAEQIAGEPNIFEIEDNAFVDAVRLNDPSKILCTYRDALQTLKVTLAANESMKSGKPIKIS